MIALTHAPHDLVVGTSDGIDVRFAGVEFKDAPNYAGASAGKPSIHVYFSGVRGEETMSRDIRYERELEEWWKQRKAAGSERSEDPPQMPGVAVFEELTTVVSDDIGTEYQWSGGKAAGTRMEWDAIWVYTPAPPAEAQMLRLEFSVGGELTGEYCEFSLSNPISADG